MPDGGDITASFTNEPAFNGNRRNLGAYGNTEQASKTYYTGSFYRVALTSTPFYGGTITIWPQVTNFMAGQSARVAATPNANFQFSGWTGSVNAVTNPVDFTVVSSTSITGLFTVVTGNEAAVYGNLQFLTTSTSVSKNAGTATIWVIRTNGLNSTVSVSYSTSNDTAVAGVNYAATSGTLSFGQGVASNSFTVPIIDRPLIEPTKQFRLSLTNPQGGAVLSSPTGMVVQLLEYRVPNPLLITTALLPTGMVGNAYSANLAATGGVPPYAWSILSPLSETFASNSFSTVGTGIVLQGDEGTRQISLPFSFPFYGGSYTQLWVDINGKIRFDSGAGDWHPLISTLANAQMISVLWADLATYNPGDVFVQTNATDATIRWQGTYFGGSAINCSVTLYASGLIQMRYGTGNANGGLIGVSSGDGVNYLVSSRSQTGSVNNVQDAFYSPLPPGLTLTSASGAITGTPLVGGTWNVLFQVTDSFNVTTNRLLPITIKSLLTDSDGDGIPDWWTMQYFGHPTGTSNDHSRASDDADGDGLSNLQEYLAGTDPTNRNSVLKIVSGAPAVGTNGFVLQWQSVNGKYYRIERGTNLLDGTPFGFLVRTNIPGVAPINTATDTTTVGNSPYFYRIRLE